MLKCDKRPSFVIGHVVCQKKMNAQFQEIVSTSASSVFGILLAFSTKNLFWEPLVLSLIME